MNFKKHILLIVAIVIIIVVTIIVFINKVGYVNSNILSFQKLRLNLPDEFALVDKDEFRGGSVDVGTIDEHMENYSYESSSESCRLRIYSRDYSLSNEKAYLNHKEDYYSLNNKEAFLIQMGWSQYDGYTPNDSDSKIIKRREWNMFTLEKTLSDRKMSKYYYYVYDYDMTFYIVEFKHDVDYGFDDSSYCSKAYHTIVSSLDFR